MITYGESNEKEVVYCNDWVKVHKRWDGAKIVLCDRENAFAKLPFIYTTVLLINNFSSLFILKEKKIFVLFREFLLPCFFSSGFNGVVLWLF